MPALPWTEWLLTEATFQFQIFLLVLVRLSGLALTGPIFGAPAVPTNIRVLLVFVLALLVTPSIGHQAAQGFSLRDGNQDQRLTSDEIPRHWLSGFSQNHQTHRHLPSFPRLMIES